LFLNFPKKRKMAPTDTKPTATANGQGKLITKTAKSKKADIDAFYKEFYINLLSMSQNRLKRNQNTIKTLEEALSARGIPFEPAEQHISKVITEEKYSVPYRRAVFHDCRLQANNAEKRVRQLRDAFIQFPR
jgi:hypothetical protein